jgi:hypothetical protein
MATNKPFRSIFFIDNILEPSIFDFEIPSFDNGYPTPKLINIWIPLSNLIKQ